MRLDRLTLSLVCGGRENTRDLEIVEDEISANLLALLLRCEWLLRWRNNIVVKKDSIAMHLTFEPEPFVKEVVDEVHQFSAATEKAFDELTVVHDITSGEVEQAKSIELSFLEDSLVLSKGICKAEVSDAVDVVVRKFPFINTTTCKVERSLTVATAFLERSFVARCVYLVLAAANRILVITPAVLRRGEERSQFAETMELIRLPITLIFSFGHRVA